MIKRIAALIVKEILALVRDPRGRVLLVGPPILQLIIFSFAATLEVKNITLAVHNQDMGRHGTEIVQRLAGSPTFTRFHFAGNREEITRLLDNQIVLAAVLIPQDFSRRLERGDSAPLQLLLDGRRSNAAQIASGYITQLVRDYGREHSRGMGAETAPPTVAERNWFNENLLYIWFTVPCLVGIISMIMALVVTALSVARERELGTFDQLMVSPLRPFEILVGKTVPAILIGLGEGLCIFVVGVLLFGVPFHGSFALLLFTLLLFILSVVGLGLFISAIAKTQQQGILGAFIILVPAVCLSGYAAPVENMPEWLQKATWLNPLKHAIITFKGLFLKDMPFSFVWENTWPLLVIGSVSLLLSGSFFSRKLE